MTDIQGSDEWLQADADRQLQALLTHYSALRQEIAGYVQSLTNLGSVALFGVAAGFTLSAELNLLPLRILLPALFCTLTLWVANHLYAMFYEGTFVSVIERQVNRLVGRQVLEWDSIWVFARRTRVNRISGESGVFLEVSSNSTSAAMNVPFMLLGTLLVIFFFSVFGYALWDGTRGVLEALSDIPTWSRLLLAALYATVQALFALAIVGVWLFWTPRSLRRQLTVWEEWYGLEPLDQQRRISEN